jgi:hypothetical protein
MQPLRESLRVQSSRVAPLGSVAGRRIVRIGEYDIADVRPLFGKGRA